MEPLINNTDTVKEHIKKHYDYILGRKKSEVVDNLEKERKRKSSKAHQQGKNALEHQKEIIRKRKKQAYQEERSQKVHELRQKKASLFEQLKQETISQLNNDKKALEGLKKHLKKIVRESTDEDVKIEIQGENVQNLRAEAKQKNKRYIYTAQQVLENNLKKYWADIAPDIRI